MKPLFHSLLSLLFFICLIAGVVAALLHPVSGQRHLALIRVTEQSTPPPPAPANAAPNPDAPPPAPSLSVQHQAAGVVDGQLWIARYDANDEGPAQMHVPDPTGEPLAPGLNLRSGPAHQAYTPGNVWSRASADTFTLRLPLVWIAAIGLGVAIVGYGSRTLYRLFTTERKPSAMCLHCNQRFEDFDAETCPSCAAPRAKVTVTKVGRPV